MALHVGQKVVCVDDSNTNLVVKGKVYTVEGIGPLPNCRAGSIIVNGIRGMVFHGMLATRFRPVVDRKSSISFTEGAPTDSETWDNRRKVEVRA